MLRIDEQPFVKKDIDKVLHQLSECWKDLAKVLQKDMKIKNRDENMQGAQNFVRKTSKVLILSKNKKQKTKMEHLKKKIQNLVLGASRSTHIGEDFNH